MFIVRFSLFVCCIVLLCRTSVCGDTSRTVNKRSDIDLQTCIENFDIHKDKIIRTQDSRDMGATYLNEIDLGSREECLRLCCETDTCDVFIYEEKNPGSCYLFHCGPPEDFKCKFTRHANYSSAVLAVNRHLNELENQIKLTKHEQDLSRLRKPDGVRPQNTRITATKITPTKDTTTATSEPILPMVPTKKIPANGRPCSRYQFECRSSSECIAIYNACDGIPQCSDGSDEAPELGCPEMATTATPSPPQPLPALTNNNYEHGGQLRKPLPPLIPDNAYQNSGASQANTRIPIDPQNANYLRPASDSRPPSHIYSDSVAVQSQPQQAFVAPRPAASNTWIPRPNNQISGLIQNSQYADKNSHIFNHKESGLQVMESDSVSGMQYGDNIHDYPKINSYYGDVYRPQYPIQDNWQQNQQSHIDNGPYVSNENWQPQFAQQQSINDQTGTAYRTNNEEKPTKWKADLKEKSTESKSYAHTVIQEPKDFEEHLKKEAFNHKKTKTDTSKSKNVDNKKDHKHTNVVVVEELNKELDLQDGEAERPGGAILSLTLGVCLTCVMAILIGCRLRVVRRRMRRGGKSPYAHDADYLVNGMYL